MATRLTLFLFIQTCSCITLPVIILDPQNIIPGDIKINPFLDFSEDQFAETIKNAIHKSRSIVVFVEDEFSVEDVSSKDALGTPYANIHQNFIIGKAKYIPRVVEPMKILERLLPPMKTDILHIKDGSIKGFSDNIKYRYIEFVGFDQFPWESRISKLRRHDAYINDIYKNLSYDQSGPILVFYTGKSNPMLYIDQTYKGPSEPTDTDTIMMVTDQALIRLSGVVLQQGALRTSLVEPSALSRRFAHRRASTRVLYDDDLELDFNFEYLMNSWLLDSVVLLEGGEEVGRTSMGVGAPYDWSYFCSEPLIIVNTRDKSYVTISKYQVEPIDFLGRTLQLQDAGVPVEAQVDTAEPAAAADSSKSSFSNVQSCGTNFNCRILAGLFVAFMVISITMWGIIMMLDVGRNDRMEDPNSKPLVIVAQL